jgi:hypothetical protein
VISKVAIPERYLGILLAIQVNCCTNSLSISNSFDCHHLCRSAPLKDLNFIQSKTDPCLYIRKDGNNFIVVGLWVDYMVIFNKEELRNLVYTLQNWTEAKRILQYLKGSKQYCLQFKRGGTITLEGYSDSD